MALFGNGNFFLSELCIFIACSELVPGIEHPLILMEFPHREGMQVYNTEQKSMFSKMLRNNSVLNKKEIMRLRRSLFLGEGVINL